MRRPVRFALLAVVLAGVAMWLAADPAASHDGAEHVDGSAQAGGAAPQRRESGSPPGSASRRSLETPDLPAASAPAAPEAAVTPSAPDPTSVRQEPWDSDEGAASDAALVVDAGRPQADGDRTPEEGLATDGDPSTCSMHSNLTTSVEFVNDCDHRVDVSWIDFDCRERLYFSLPPDARRTQQTYVTHIWRVRDAATQTLLQQAFPLTETPIVVRACGDHTVRHEEAADAGVPDRRTCMPKHAVAREPPLCSQKNGAPMTLAFDNNCAGTTVALFWVDFDCKERPYGLVNANATRQMKTYVTHTWRIRDATNGALYREFVPRTPLPQTVQACPCD